MWKVGEEIGNKEGRFDICITGHGMCPLAESCLEYSANRFQKVNRFISSPRYLLTSVKVLDVNTSGVLYTAQAAGRQMARFKNGGSIILVASMAGSGHLKESGIGLGAYQSVSTSHYRA